MSRYNTAVAANDDLRQHKLGSNYYRALSCTVFMI